MANVNQVADPVALPIVPCPECGRRVVTFVARSGQFEGERFYKCRNHNKGGCDFYRWQEAYVEHLASLGPAAPPLAQINPGENEVGGGGQGGQLQATNGVAGGHNGAEVLPRAPAASDGDGSVHAAAAVAPRQFTIAFDPASINLVVSVGNMAICVAILVLVVASSVMRVFDRD